MANTLAWKNFSLVLNGERITGFAKDDPPVELPDLEVGDNEMGWDGSLYSSDTGVLGGDVVIKLLPTSKQCGWFLDRLEEHKRGIEVDFHGKFGDVRKGITHTLAGGRFKKCPSGIMPGKTFEVTITFETIKAQTAGAKLNPAPVGA